MSVFQELYDSEINFEVAPFWDCGFEVRLGDKLNGFVARGRVNAWDDVGPWLEEQALEHFPLSVFAQARDDRARRSHDGLRELHRSTQ